MPLVEGFASVATDKQRLEHEGNQFLIGDDLLLAPWFAGETRRSVLLAPGA